MKTNDLLDVIGEAKDEYIRDAKQQKKHTIPHWVRWVSVTAACLCLVLGGFWFYQRLGGNAEAGSGSNDDLTYMYYVGPVLPMTIQGDCDSIEAVRNVNFDFSPYCGVQKQFENDAGETVVYDSWEQKALISDQYVLENRSSVDQTVTILYPYSGNIREVCNYPKLKVNGTPVQANMYPGPYTGGFEGAGGAKNQDGTLNLAPLNSFAGYEQLLSSTQYLNSSLDSFPAMDIPVTVYHLHDFIFTDNQEAEAPTIKMQFLLDDSKSKVLTYGINGSEFNPETGQRAYHIGGIQYRPDAAEGHRYPDDGYIIILGEDIEGYTIRGYMNGGCREEEVLPDLGCVVTRNESTLQEVISYLMMDFEEKTGFIEESQTACGTDAVVPPSHEMLCGLAGELLETYGLLGNCPAERYENGMLEDVFSAVYSDGRIIYFSFDVTIPAGEKITAEAAMVRNGSCNYVGKNKNRDGYDMATQLGSGLVFKEQNASISGFDEIEIVRQNFGFDPANGITKVSLNLDQNHYWMEIIRPDADSGK